MRLVLLHPVPLQPVMLLNIAAGHFLSGLAMWSLFLLLPFYCLLLMICVLLPFWRRFPSIVQVPNMGTSWLRALQKQVIVISLVIAP
jgi:hypothetical protein